MARRFDGLRPAGAARLVAAVFSLLVFFLLLPGLRLLLVFFFELRAGLPVDFFPVFVLAFEADFFLVTFLRASFRLGFDLPALAVFFRLVFFLLLFLLVFLLVFFLLAFFALVFFGGFLADFFFLLVFFRLETVAARLREVFFAVLFDPRFFDVAFLVGMRVDSG